MAITNVLYKYFHKEQNEVVFFYGNNLHSSSDHDHHTINALNFSNLHKIIGWINGTKKTLDVCLYILSNDYLLKAITNAHNRGVYVRLILNDDVSMKTWNSSFLGISKIMKDPKYNCMLMHHKFIIVDNERVILGSVNWTYKAFRLNWENCFITNERTIVNSYKHEFQRLWQEFCD